jgi:hypothetical protein
MTKDVSAKKQKGIEGFLSDVQKWASELQFIQGEIVFIKKLLHTDVFKPKTPNLFERIQKYMGSLESFENEVNSCKLGLMSYEAKLETLIESVEPDHADLEIKHLKAVADLDAIQGKFQKLKSEIFEYIGGILRKK